MSIEIHSFIQENVFESVICKKVAILSLPRVNSKL